MSPCAWMLRTLSSVSGTHDSQSRDTEPGFFSSSSFFFKELEKLICFNVTVAESKSHVAENGKQRKYMQVIKYSSSCIVPLLHISLTHLCRTYLQYNLNGEHGGEYNICIGQDLREQCKQLCRFFFSLIKAKIRWHGSWLLPGSCRTWGQWDPQPPVR